MIYIRSEREIAALRVAGQLTADTLNYLSEYIKPGVTTLYLNGLAHEYIVKHNGTPSFLGYQGFKGSICASPDDVVVHGIPSGKVKLAEGMIISIDIGAVVGGFHGDAARTYPVGQVSEDAKRLMRITKECFNRGAAKVREGARTGDIGAAVQGYAEANGCGVVRALQGHGIGQKLHEEPDVPNYGAEGTGVRLKAGMAICIEPMINAGTHEVYTQRDGWTVRTADGSLSAHYENTLLVTREGFEILTAGIIDNDI